MRLSLSLLLLSAVANMASAFLGHTRQAVVPSTQPLHMYESVEAAIAEAQRICARDPSSNECRVAWDIVEELEAADSHLGGPTQAATTDANSNANLMVGSFDILSKKIYGKMDQLRATATQLETMGAPGDMHELVRLADEMQAALANSRYELNL